MPINRENVFQKIYAGRSAVILGGDEVLYEGMKTNQELVTHLVNGCSYPHGFPLSLLEVGEYFSELNGKSLLIEEIMNLIDIKPGKSPILEAIGNSKHITDVFATTMDECLQSYFDTNELVIIRSDKDVSRAFSKGRRLYRLNGSIADGEKMIVTKTQLVNQLASGLKSPLISHLAFNLTSKQFLIIGHDLRQWGFSYYFQQVTNQLGDFREKALLFTKEPDPVLVSSWNKKNIEVLLENPVDFFQEYLEWEHLQ